MAASSIRRRSARRPPPAPPRTTASDTTRVAKRTRRARTTQLDLYPRQRAPSPPMYDTIAVRVPKRSRNDTSVEGVPKTKRSHGHSCKKGAVVPRPVCEPAKATASFQNLPAELREVIYYDLIGPPKALHRVTNGTRHEIASVGYNLALTNKLFREEFAKFYITRQTLSIRLDEVGDFISRFWPRDKATKQHGSIVLTMPFPTHSHKTLISPFTVDLTPLLRLLSGSPDTFECAVASLQTPATEHLMDDRLRKLFRSLFVSKYRPEGQLPTLKLRPWLPKYFQAGQVHGTELRKVELEIGAARYRDPRYRARHPESANTLSQQLIMRLYWDPAYPKQSDHWHHWTHDTCGPQITLEHQETVGRIKGGPPKRSWAIEGF